MKNDGTYFFEKMHCHIGLLPFAIATQGLNKIHSMHFVVLVYLNQIGA